MTIQGSGNSIPQAGTRVAGVHRGVERLGSEREGSHMLHFKLHSERHGELLKVFSRAVQIQRPN